MTGEADLAAIGSLLSDRTRATILTTLLNGGLTPASKLAERAGVSRSLASSHLRKLTEGGLITVEPLRRQRLYRLSGQHVADALEVLLLMAPLAPVQNLKASRERDGLREARLCYDHLAGRQGVAITDGLLAGRLLVPSPGGYTVTTRGESALRALDIDVEELRGRPRQLTRACMDRSEGRHHLAGGLGAALTGDLLRRGWLQSREASRVVSLTPAGRTGLRDALGVVVREQDDDAPGVHGFVAHGHGHQHLHSDHAPAVGP
ncbi:ArsR/SmtB family transcription factor [Patulibacter minatonensis]|uniref:ArsR/SmtB family transcription factor n=1 Tax=Patulibacter minatonensis TaxID=298163 RepID=UPI0006841803|nr:helix-turn-helix transcriptional regulator [Patulibacter minatonensis]